MASTGTHALVAVDEQGLRRVAHSAAERFVSRATGREREREHVCVVVAELALCAVDGLARNASLDPAGGDRAWTACLPDVPLPAAYDGSGAVGTTWSAYISFLQQSIAGTAVRVDVARAAERTADALIAWLARLQAHMPHLGAVDDHEAMRELCRHVMLGSCNKVQAGRQAWRNTPYYHECEDGSDGSDTSSVTSRSDTEASSLSERDLSTDTEDDCVGSDAPPSRQPSGELGDLCMPRAPSTAMLSNGTACGPSRRAVRRRHDELGCPSKTLRRYYKHTQCLTPWISAEAQARTEAAASDDRDVLGSADTHAEQWFAWLTRQYLETVYGPECVAAMGKLARGRKHAALERRDKALEQRRQLVVEAENNYEAVAYVVDPDPAAGSAPSRRTSGSERKALAHDMGWKCYVPTDALDADAPDAVVAVLREHMVDGVWVTLAANAPTASVTDPRACALRLHRGMLHPVPLEHAELLNTYMSARAVCERALGTRDRCPLKRGLAPKARRQKQHQQREQQQQDRTEGTLRARARVRDHDPLPRRFASGDVRVGVWRREHFGIDSLVRRLLYGLRVPSPYQAVRLLRWLARQQRDGGHRAVVYRHDDLGAVRPSAYGTCGLSLFADALVPPLYRDRFLVTHDSDGVSHLVCRGAGDVPLWRALQLLERLRYQGRRAPGTASATGAAVESFLHEWVALEACARAPSSASGDLRLVLAQVHAELWGVPSVCQPMDGGSSRVAAFAEPERATAWVQYDRALQHCDGWNAGGVVDSVRFVVASLFDGALSGDRGGVAHVMRQLYPGLAFQCGRHSDDAAHTQGLPQNYQHLGFDPDRRNPRREFWPVCAAEQPQSQSQSKQPQQQQQQQQQHRTSAVETAEAVRRRQARKRSTRELLPVVYRFADTRVGVARVDRWLCLRDEQGTRAFLAGILYAQARRDNVWLPSPASGAATAAAAAAAATAGSAVALVEPHVCTEFNLYFAIAALLSRVCASRGDHYFTDEFAIARWLGQHDAQLSAALAATLVHEDVVEVEPVCSAAHNTLFGHAVLVPRVDMHGRGSGDVTSERLVHILQVLTTVALPVEMRRDMLFRLCAGPGYLELDARRYAREYDRRTGLDALVGWLAGSPERARASERCPQADSVYDALCYYAVALRFFLSVTDRHQRHERLRAPFASFVEEVMRQGDAASPVDGCESGGGGSGDDDTLSFPSYYMRLEPATQADAGVEPGSLLHTWLAPGVGTLVHALVRAESIHAAVFRTRDIPRPPGVVSARAEARERDEYTAALEVGVRRVPACVVCKAAVARNGVPAPCECGHSMHYGCLLRTVVESIDICYYPLDARAAGGDDASSMAPSCAVCGTVLDFGAYGPVFAADVECLLPQPRQVVAPTDDDDITLPVTGTQLAAKRQRHWWWDAPRTMHSASLYD